MPLCSRCGLAALLALALGVVGDGLKAPGELVLELLGEGTVEEHGLHHQVRQVRTTVAVEHGDQLVGGRQVCREAQLVLIQPELTGVDAAAPVGQVHAHGRQHEQDLDQGRLLHHLHGVGAEGGQRSVLQDPLVPALREAEGRERHQQAGEQGDQHQNPDHLQGAVDLLRVVGDGGQDAEREQDQVPEVGPKEREDVHEAPEGCWTSGATPQRQSVN